MKKFYEDYIYTAAAYTVSFSQSTYSVEEDSGSVEIQLLLSEVTSVDVIIEVLSMDDSTNGKFQLNLPCVTSYVTI